MRRVENISEPTADFDLNVQIEIVDDSFNLYRRRNLLSNPSLTTTTTNSRAISSMININRTEY